jgi:hypothetical protein
MRRTRMLAAVALAILSAVVVASAATAGTIKVSGTQVVIDENAGAYEMHGSLVGTWNVTAYTEHYKTPSTYAASGKEKFVGCIDTDRSGACDPGEPAGTMSFTFVYWATFNPATKGLVRGACVHPVIGATGDLAAAKGVIFMKDTPVGDSVRTTYTGTLTVASVRTPAGRTLAVRAPATCGGH